MRDAGLDEAIRAAGGVGALAQKIGISQPSVSNWSRVPAERVVGVEAVTGIPRATLRPDLYGTQGDIYEVDAARAPARGSPALRHRTQRRQLRAGRPRRHAVRDHVRTGERQASRAGRRRPRAVRETSRALAGTVLR